MHMNYLIENQIIFNAEDNSLSLRGDSESKIAVSNPARRILLLLIEQQGMVVDRETFFKKVWDDYGLTASNNNLNHCISKLRKVMVTLGYLNEFIVTVPKVGFTIRKEIVIEPCISDETVPTPEVRQKTAPYIDEIITAEPRFPRADKEPCFRRDKHQQGFVIILLVTTALTAWVFFILHNGMRDPKAELKIAWSGVCDLYSTAPVTLSRRGEFITLASQFLKDKNIPCKSGDILIFQSERFSSPINTGSVRDFMAQCSTDDNDKANICISYYTNDRTTHDK